MRNKLGDVVWEEVEEISEEKPILLPLSCKGPNEKDYFLLNTRLLFSHFCNEEELIQITEIVYKAYLRNKENEDE